MFSESWLVSFLSSNSDFILAVSTYLEYKTISVNLLSSYIEKYCLAGGTNKKPKCLFGKMKNSEYDKCQLLQNEVRIYFIQPDAP